MLIILQTPDGKQTMQHIKVTLGWSAGKLFFPSKTIVTKTIENIFLLITQRRN